jgi:hypothetical protein
MLSIVEPGRAEECRKLWQEAHELTLIFASIAKKILNLNFLKL